MGSISVRNLGLMLEASRNLLPLVIILHDYPYSTPVTYKWAAFLRGF